MAHEIKLKDLDELIRFHQHLVHFNTTLAEEFRRINGSWHEVQTVWQDRKAEELGQELGELWPGIQRYLERTQDHDHYLRWLIEHLEALRQRHV